MAKTFGIPILGTSKSVGAADPSGILGIGGTIASSRARSAGRRRAAKPVLVLAPMRPSGGCRNQQTPARRRLAGGGRCVGGVPEGAGTAGPFRATGIAVPAAQVAADRN
jgi:hypothetical protein